MKNILAGKKDSIAFVGFITGIGALFLNIPIPEQTAAKEALANIQIFWLILFTASLVYVGIGLVESVFRYEKEIEGRYNLATIGVFSFTAAAVLFWLVVNLFGYIVLLYSTSFAKLLIMTFPGIATELSFLLLFFVEKRKRDFSLLSQIVINSSIGALLISIGGFYIIHSRYWFSLILPITFIVLLLLLLIAAKKRKIKLLSYIKENREN